MAQPRTQILLLLVSVSLFSSIEPRLIALSPLSSAHRGIDYVSAYSVAVLGDDIASQNELYARIVKKEVDAHGTDVVFESILTQGWKIEVINVRGGLASEETAMRAISTADVALIVVSAEQCQDGKAAEIEALRTAFAAGINDFVVAVNTMDEYNSEEAYNQAKDRIHDEINKIRNREVNVRFALVNTKANTNIWSLFEDVSWYNEEYLIEQILYSLMDVLPKKRRSELTFSIISHIPDSDSTFFGRVTRGTAEKDNSYLLCPEEITTTVREIKTRFLKREGEVGLGEYANIEVSGWRAPDPSLFKNSYLTSDQRCSTTKTVLILIEFYDTFQSRSIKQFVANVFFGSFHAELTFQGSCEDEECPSPNQDANLQPEKLVAAKVVADAAYPFEEIKSRRNSILFRENGKTVGRAIILSIYS